MIAFSAFSSVEVQSSPCWSAPAYLVAELFQIPLRLLAGHGISKNKNKNEQVSLIKSLIVAPASPVNGSCTTPILYV